MQYDDATSQIAQIEQQTQALAQQFQTLGQKLNSHAPDAATGKEWLLDLKQIALNVQSQNQQLAGMINQMAEHIRNLEQQLDTHPNPSVQARGVGATKWRHAAAASGATSRAASGWARVLASPMPSSAGFLTRYENRGYRPPLFPLSPSGRGKGEVTSCSNPMSAPGRNLLTCD